MDEVAYEAGIDPVEIRLLNDSAVDPYSGRQLSTHSVSASKK
jgi:CO/xanthine dehydrogenase Mo-binding subunit